LRVWIDLANSPHVSIFKPLMDRLEEKGHSVVTTARDFAQTIPLAERRGITATHIGAHGGRSSVGKAANLVDRSWKLVRYVKKERVDLALSHNSYSQIVAGRMARIRVVTMMDYEGQPANHLAFRFAHRVLVPDCFPDEALKRFGARRDRVHKYRGFKEQIYLSDFEPDEGFRDELVAACNLPPDFDLDKTLLITVRTPATMAAYHRFDNPLFDILLADLDRRSDVTVIALPRTPEQAQEIRVKYPSLHVPKRPLDGRHLIYYSDLVVSGGGTMNREAAVLGTPAYTIFAGALPAVDLRLIEMERLIPISRRAGLDRLCFEKKRKGCRLVNRELIDEIIGELVP
jgi:predicted glycosyltransferase